MKKIRRAFWGLILSLLLTGTALGAQIPKITVGSASGNAGDTVILPVGIQQNSGLAGWMLEISWDPAVLELGANVTPGSAFSGGTLLPGKAQDGKLRVFWYSTGNQSADGTMLTLQFKIVDSAKGGRCNVEVQALADNTVDENGNLVTVQTSGGSVQVIESPQKPVEEMPDTADGVPGTVNRPKDVPLSVAEFSDVPQTHWARNYIETLARRGIICGSDGRFYPERSVTRAEFVKMLAGILGADISASDVSGFVDVQPGSWASPYIAWASEMGLVTGTDATHFVPNAHITREQIAAILLRSVQKLELSLPEGRSAPAFTDTAQVSGYASDAILVIARAGLISGYPDGTFRPKDNATRAEASKLLAEVLEITGLEI